MRNNRMLRAMLCTLAVAAMLVALAGCGAGASGPEDVTFNLEVAGRALVGDQDTFVARQGDTVTFNISSDEPGAVHLHGYEQQAQVTPDAPASMMFEAEATGRFNLEMHVTGCGVDTEDLAVEVMAMPGEAAGSYVVTANSKNFEVSEESGRHWHLYIDGTVQGMIYEPSTEVQLGPGSHELAATLVTADHCELLVSDSVMVDSAADTDQQSTGGESVDEHDQQSEDSDETQSEDHDHEHEHTGETVDISLGALEVRPR